MKKWRVAAVILVVSLLAVILAGCLKTAATVNGVAIPQTDVDEQIAELKKQQPARYDGEQGQEQEKNDRELILEQLIAAELIRQEAAKRGIKVSDKEVNDKLDQVKKIFNDDKKFEEALRQKGMTVEKYKEKIKDSLISEKVVSILIKGITVSDAEVKEYFDKNASEYTDPEQLRVRHILVKSEDKAKQALDQIKAGDDFSEKAKAVSEDEATKSTGGDLGYRLLNQFPPAQSSALKVLGVGQVSEVIKDDQGYHVFKVEDKKEARQKSFDEVKDEVKQRIIIDRQREKFLSWLEGLKKKAKIEK